VEDPTRDKSTSDIMSPSRKVSNASMRLLQKQKSKIPLKQQISKIRKFDPNNNSILKMHSRKSTKKFGGQALDNKESMLSR